MLELYSTEEEKRQFLLDYGKKLHQKLNRPLKASDFYGVINKKTIAKYFTKFSLYFEACGSISNRRLRQMNDEQLKEFLHKIKVITQKGCWETNYYSNRKRRLQIKFKGKNIFIYKVSFLLWNGSIPHKKCLLHLCDNQKCFNPEHLKLGSHQENARDMVAKGRYRRGKNTRKKSTLKDPYDFDSILKFVKENTIISPKNEFLYTGYIKHNGYVNICISGKYYLLHRLILANKLNKKYEEVKITCHRLPDGTKPMRHDLNPEHLHEGTYSDNTLDTSSYSRSFKLSDEQIKEIRLDLKLWDFSKRGNKKKFDLKWSQILKICPETVSDIRRNVSWRNK